MRKPYPTLYMVGNGKMQWKKNCTIWSLTTHRSSKKYHKAASQLDSSGYSESNITQINLSLDSRLD